MSANVLVTSRSFALDPSLPARLAATGCLILPNPYGEKPTEDQLVELLAEAEAAVVGSHPLTARAIQSAPRLRAICRTGVGTDSVDIAAATAAGVVVTNTPAANSAAVADLALGLMLAVARGIPRRHQATKAGQWPTGLGIELGGKTLGLVGLGRIGRGVARRARGFDMAVLAYDPYVSAEAAAEIGAEPVSLAELLARADFISLHTPLTPETRRLINTETLALVKPTAILVNTARGGLVDEAALAAALREGRLAAAALDVFDREPPAGSPLLELDNVVLTPHTGAHTREAIARMGSEAIDNLLAVLAGQRPPGIVNPEVFMR